MLWLEQWHALAARIDGLMRAADFLATGFKVHGADVFSIVRKVIAPELKEITGELQKLSAAAGEEMPPAALAALKRYLAAGWQTQLGDTGTRGEVALQIVAAVAAFRSEFEYLIRDSEVESRSRTELAFEHLRRQITVDEDIQSKWANAFNAHETSCERLGAVHLLSHGIWAFKITGPGGATDLVYGDPVENSLPLTRKIARALVLTEWKLVKQSKDLDGKAREARTQTALYSSGVLGDLELQRTRYMVLVSQTELNAPTDITDKGILYRHMIIPVKPKSPSQTARTRGSNTA